MRQYVDTEDRWHVKSGPWGRLLFKRYAQYLVTIQQWLGKEVFWRISTDLILHDPMDSDNYSIKRMYIARGKTETIQKAIQASNRTLPLIQPRK